MITDKWILIVDDEDGILSILKNSLVKLGREYRVVTASDGYTALNHLKRFRFDLVVTDYKMAGMSGLELLERIHHVQPDMRVILMTGYGNNSVQAEATRLKAYQYLAKPLEIETFRQVIQEAIGNSAGCRGCALCLPDRLRRPVHRQIGKFRQPSADQHRRAARWKHCHVD